MLALRKAYSSTRLMVAMIFALIWRRTWAIIYCDSNCTESGSFCVYGDPTAFTVCRRGIRLGTWHCSSGFLWDINKKACNWPMAVPTTQCPCEGLHLSSSSPSETNPTLSTTTTFSPDLIAAPVDYQHYTLASDGGNSKNTRIVYMDEPGGEEATSHTQFDYSSPFYSVNPAGLQKTQNPPINLIATLVPDRLQDSSRGQKLSSERVQVQPTSGDGSVELGSEQLPLGSRLLKYDDDYDGTATPSSIFSSLATSKSGRNSISNSAAASYTQNYSLIMFLFLTVLSYELLYRTKL